ncbi:MAG: hypothetical protein JNK85_07310 [Verrucomicrobiales bacterium]|nr:hypothetical protein [Verrucomicrobiales bacterium]
MNLPPPIHSAPANPGDGLGTETKPGRGPGLALALFFLTICAGGLVLQTAIELSRGEPVGALQVFHQRPTAANLRAYEHSLEDASVLARTVRPWFQFIQFVGLRDGGEKTLIGRDGWLFYKPGCDALISRAPHPSGTNQDPVRAIVAWRDALATRGIQLLVLPVPNKESIYPDRLTSRNPPPPGVLSPVTRDLFARLKSSGVEVVDLFALFSESRKRGEDVSAPLYLAQDSHWSPAGLRMAAQAVAHRLVERGWVSPGHHDFETEAAPIHRIGDMLLMLRSRALERRAQPESVACSKIVDARTRHPCRDDPQSEVLVLGDSFLRIFESDEPGAAGFLAHLAHELRRPIARLVADGGASTLVRQELFRRPALLARKRVVIWQFVERDLRLGTEGWQAVPLPPTVPNTETGSSPTAPTSP